MRAQAYETEGAPSGGQGNPMRLAIFLAGLLATLTATCGPARAAESDVTTELVCAAQCVPYC